MCLAGATVLLEIEPIPAEGLYISARLGPFREIRSIHAEERSSQSMPQILAPIISLDS
jgi:hypothetical protein